MDKILGLLGLAKKAGRLETGEEPVGAACRAREARLLLLADDAAPNTVRRAAHFSEAGACVMLTIPVPKAILGAAVGRSSCAMLAVTDIGFADAIAKRLAALDEAHYGLAAERLALKAQRAAERRREQEQHEKNLRMGKHRMPPPPPPEPRPKPAPKRQPAHEPARHERPHPTAPGNTAHPTQKRGTQTKRSPAGAQKPPARFSGSMPVKKGKGSDRKHKPSPRS